MQGASTSKGASSAMNPQEKKRSTLSSTGWAWILSRSSGVMAASTNTESSLKILKVRDLNGSAVTVRAVITKQSLGSFAGNELRNIVAPYTPTYESFPATSLRMSSHMMTQRQRGSLGICSIASD